MLLGVPAHLTSISPTRADATPAAIRGAFARFSTYSIEHRLDIAELAAWDAGDVSEPDFDAGEQRVAERIGHLPRHELLLALGGDNSITYSVMRGRFGERLPDAGLVTLDAHFDLRDGVSNGSPVRRIVEAGLPGHRIVQVGIADFSNSQGYADRAREYGITVITRSEVARRGIDEVMQQALAIAGGGSAGVHVDLDVDVCDRAAVPACPASAPGGISAHELRRAAFLAGAHPSVRSVDVTEIDAESDAPDGRTIRLGALCVLEAAAGLAVR